MRLRYDERVDAAYVTVGRDKRNRGVDCTERLDQDRNVDYDAEDRIIGYELLNIRRLGVRLDDLPHRDELTHLFAEAGFSERDRGAPVRVTARRTEPSA